MTRFLFVLINIAIMAFAQSSAAQDGEFREGGLTGTGISGIITHLGSIYVNDQHITYPSDVPVNSALGPIRARELRPGDTVAAQVEWQGDAWVAQEIRQIHPIIGPVSELAEGRVTIMGTSVDIHAIEHTKIEIGDWLAVSGLWRNHEVVASDIVQISPQPQAHILGSYVPPQAGQELKIGQTAITGLIPQHAQKGDVIRVSGHPMTNGLNVQTLDLGFFDHSIGLLLAQGYLSQPDTKGHYTILGSGLSAYTDTPAMIQTVTTVTRCGGGGRLLSDTSLLPLETLTNMQRLGCKD